MTRVGIAELKAHLSEHLRAVRSGGTVIVLDRDLPIATIVPYASQPAIDIRPAPDRESSFADLRPPKRKGKTNSLAALLEDRARR